MTTKQIAEAVSKPERTVQGWAKRTGAKLASAGAKLASAQMSGGKGVDWSLEEACAIIETGLGKNAAALYRQNAQHSQTVTIGGESSLTKKDLETIASIVSMVMANLDKRVSTIEQRVDQRQALLPAPQISPRQNISKLVRKYAEKNDFEYNEVWRELYREYGYRTHSNPSIAAKNRGMSVIDYLDSEGQIETLEAVALDFLGGA